MPWKTQWELNSLGNLARNIIDVRIKNSAFSIVRVLTSLALKITILVGKLVVGRLKSHAGSLINLAKHPAATVQVLGAEEVLCRVVKLSLALQNGQLVDQSNAKLEVKCRVSSLLAELMHLVSLLA